MNNVKEKDFQDHLVQYAKNRGWQVYHTFDSRRCAPGFPDLVLVRDKILYRELKTEKGKLTPAQKTWGEMLVCAGADYAVWRPSMIKEIYKQLA